MKNLINKILSHPLSVKAFLDKQKAPGRNPGALALAVASDALI